MNKEWKQKWVAALRSGEYVQGKGLLRYTDVDNITSHCALGVLCDLWWKRYGEAHDASFEKWIFSGGELVADISATVDLKDGDPVIKAKTPGGGRFSITEMNDDYGFTFNEIAALIEELL